MTTRMPDEQKLREIEARLSDLKAGQIQAEEKIDALHEEIHVLLTRLEALVSSSNSSNAKSKG